MHHFPGGIKFVGSVSKDYLQNEMARLDLLLHREIMRLRAAYQLSLDEFRGLYVSDQQVDDLIRQAPQGTVGAEPLELTNRAEMLHAANLESLAPDSSWKVLRDEFGLSPLEMDLVLLAAATEVHPKYETLYAYLNNDVTRKWPTCDLALRLFASTLEQKFELRRALFPSSRLFGNGLLRLMPLSADRAAWLSTAFSLAPEVCRYLLGFPVEPCRGNDFLERIQTRADWDDLAVVAELRHQLAMVPEIFGHGCGRTQLPLIVLIGRYGTGAERVAEAICTHLNVPLMYLNVERARASDEQMRKIAHCLGLEQRLEGTGIYLKECGVLFGAEGHATAEGHALLAALAAGRGPLFFAFEPETRWRELLQGQRKLVFELEEPDYEERRKLWRALSSNAVPASLADDLANRF